MIAIISASILLARISVIAVGETVRLLGSLILLLTGRPGIPAEAPQPATPAAPAVAGQQVSQGDEMWYIKPTVCRAPLGRDPITGMPA